MIIPGSKNANRYPHPYPRYCCVFNLYCMPGDERQAVAPEQDARLRGANPRRRPNETATELMTPLRVGPRRGLIFKFNFQIPRKSSTG